MASTRANIITRRTYNRPLNEEGTLFESWEETVNRVIQHQHWLWSRMVGNLSKNQLEELETLRKLIYDRKVMVAGRTLFLGGTEIAKRRECSQFNCSFIEIKSVQDVVDAFWLLLNGCGVGFKPIVGELTGFSNRVNEFVIIPNSKDKKKHERNQSNVEKLEIENNVVTWYLCIGDSAEAWADSIGKLLSIKTKIDKIILDFSEIRPAGTRLKGYGWICSGASMLIEAYKKIIDILNDKAGKCLSAIDILDIMNLLGTVLSSRRSAEIALLDYGNNEWKEFATAKKDYWKPSINKSHRSQSNNSLIFNEKPSLNELKIIFDLMTDSGGSEPGFINRSSALKRASYFRGVNPCAEILLPNKGFCNLVEVNVSAFDSFNKLLEAVRLIARANYRQTCVNLKDGVLSEEWHYNNEYYRLCGVGLTGLEMTPELLEANNVKKLQLIKSTAIAATHEMAKELGLELPKNTTTIKPSGTLSKIMDCTEGIHKPLGMYIFNNVVFSKHDPLTDKLIKANYNTIQHPFDDNSIIITLPISYESVKFNEVIVNGKKLHVNQESAIDQLNKYKYVMNNYVEHNCSITVSYSIDEIPDIINWLDKNWDDYVGVSFIYRNDPTKTAADLGYPYLPQEVVTEEIYKNYVSKLKPVNIDEHGVEVDLTSDCSQGMCPVR